MMPALLSNGVKTIIIERLDRLARELMVQEKTIGGLQRDGFTLVSVQEPDLMSSDPARIAFRQMMGVFAQYDKSQIVLKLKAARMRKRSSLGLFTSGRQQRLADYDPSVGGLQIVGYGWYPFWQMCKPSSLTKLLDMGSLQPQAASVAATDGQANLPALPERIM